MKQRSLHLCVAALTLITLITLARSAYGAGAYDPNVPYYTLETPKFYVVFAEGYEHIAIRTAQIAEELLPYMVKRYGYEPDGRITIVIDDQFDAANGSASVLPNKIITLFVTAPTEVSGLEDYEDWLYMVINHEMAHIIHLDMVYGLPWVGRLIFGKYVALNQYTAGWTTEGLAVYEETASSASGRGRSSYASMVIRMAVLDDVLPGIDQALRSYANWPFGNAAYFVGGRFQQWLASKYGEEALFHYHRAYAATPIPYLTWWASALAFDATLESLWLAFEKEMKEDAKRLVSELEKHPMGITEARRLTHYGGNVLGPRVTPDGKYILFSTSSPKDGERVRRISIGGEEDDVLLDDTFSKAFAFSPDGRYFYAQQTEINQRFYAQNSILRYDLQTQDVEKIELPEKYNEEFLAPSGSMRARDPDASKDGKQLVFVQTPYGSNRLVLADLEKDGITIHPKVIVPAEPDVQLSNPRFSPDGRQIAVSRFRRGRRDIVIYDRAGKLVRSVTQDRALDLDPFFTPDGRWLLFSSDRTGIYNIYAYDLKNDQFRQLTNLVSGGYQPSVSPDGKTLVFRGYSSEGFDVFTLPFEPERGPIVEIPPVPRATPVDTQARAFPPPRADRPTLPPPAPFKGAPLPELPEGWRIKDYTSIDTFLPFQDNWNLLPRLQADEREVFGRLTTVGTDALGTQTYSLSVTYRTATNFVGGGASYINDMLEPTFGIGVGASSRLFVLRDTSGELLDDYVEKVLSGSISIGVPYLQRHYISASYFLEDRSQFNELDPRILQSASALPAGGRFAGVRLGYTYANIRAFAHSISAERGYSLGVALSGLAPGLGSEYEQIVLTAQTRGYISLPYEPDWLQNHVVAISFGASAGWGPNRGELFRLGGVSGESLLTTTTENFFNLRGLKTSILVGSAVASGSVEYRAPILRVDRGIGTFPFSLQVIHAALFSDFGRVFDDLDLDTLTTKPLTELAVSAGGELRADILLGYSIGLELRLGYAQLLYTPRSEVRAQVDASGPYFQIGSIF